MTFGAKILTILYAAAGSPGVTFSRQICPSNTVTGLYSQTVDKVQAVTPGVEWKDAARILYCYRNWGSYPLNASLSQKYHTMVK